VEPTSPLNTMAGYSFTVAPGERCALCEVQRHLPTARVEVFTAEGALVGHVAPVDEAAPSTSPAPEVPHPYGEGLW